MCTECVEDDRDMYRRKGEEERGGDIVVSSSASAAGTGPGAGADADVDAGAATILMEEVERGVCVCMLSNRCHVVTHYVFTCRSLLESCTPWAGNECGERDGAFPDGLFCTDLPNLGDLGDLSDVTRARSETRWRFYYLDCLWDEFEFSNDLGSWRPPALSLTNPSSHSPIHSPILPLTHPLTHSLTHRSIHPLTHRSISSYSSIHPSSHSSIHPSSHSPTASVSLYISSNQWTRVRHESFDLLSSPPRHSSRPRLVCGCLALYTSIHGFEGPGHVSLSLALGCEGHRRGLRGHARRGLLAGVLRTIPRAVDVATTDLYRNMWETRRLFGWVFGYSNFYCVASVLDRSAAVLSAWVIRLFA